MFNKLKKFVSKNQEITNVQNSVDEVISPIISKEILAGRLIKDLTITAGTPLRIEHKLDRQIQGYIIVSQDNSVKIYESEKTDKFLTLNVDAVETFNVTDWVAYTPTLMNLTNSKDVQFWYRRVGDSIDVRGSLTLTGVAGGQIGVQLPAGLFRDTSKIHSDVANHSVVGVALGYNDSVADFWMGAITTASNYSGLYARGPATELIWTVAVPFAWANLDRYSVSISNMPISGWEKYTTTYPETTFSLWVF